MQALLSQACKRQPGPGEAVAESALGAGPLLGFGMGQCPSLPRTSRARAELPALSLGVPGGRRCPSGREEMGCDPTGAGLGGWLLGQMSTPQLGCAAPVTQPGSLRWRGEKPGLQRALDHEGALQLPELPKCWWWHPWCLCCCSGLDELLWDGSTALDPFPDPGERQSRGSQARWDCPGGRDLCWD